MRPVLNSGGLGGIGGAAAGQAATPDHACGRKGGANPARLPRGLERSTGNETRSLS